MRCLWQEISFRSVAVLICDKFQSKYLQGSVNKFKHTIPINEIYFLLVHRELSMWRCRELLVPHLLFLHFSIRLLLVAILRHSFRMQIGNCSRQCFHSYMKINCNDFDKWRSILTKYKITSYLRICAWLESSRGAAMQTAKVNAKITTIFMFLK